MGTLNPAQSINGTAGQLLIISKIRPLKVEHPKFEGHVTTNEDKYHKSVQKKFTFCLGVSQFAISLLITRMLVKEKSAIFTTFWPLWPWPWIGSYGIQLSITHQPLPTYHISLKLGKICRRADGHMDVRMDERTLRPALLGWLVGVDLIIILWHPLLPYSTAIKHPVPDRVKPSFVIFDIRALWRSGLSFRVPGCQKLQMMA